MSKLLDDLLADQRRRWHGGEPRPVEDYLAEHPALAGDDEGLVDLLYQEYVLRAALGPPPLAEDFFRRFPRHRAALEAQLSFLRAAQDLGGRATLTAAPAPATLLPPAPGPARPLSGDDDWPCIEGYEIQAELGRGATGVVYRAWHHALRRAVALKVLHPGRARDPQALARFRSEAEAAARLHHPHIVQVHEVGAGDSRPYLAMELVEGATLARRLADGPLPARQAAQLVEALARAVHHAHGRAVVHRDLKPANILLASGGREPPVEDGTGGSRPPLAEYVPKITDFGLAKQLDEAGGQRTESGAILGTPSYMAPEQAAGGGQAVGPAADVYALGAILHEALTGRPPFLADTPLETLHRVLNEEPIPPSRLQPKVPRDLDTVCLKCLEKAPHRRYESAAALADDLGRYLRGEPTRARPAGYLGRLGRWCRRKPVIAGLSAALLLALAVGGGGTLFQLWQADAARREAEASDAQVQQLLNEVLQSRPDEPLGTK
jgi:serine/threonine-protein kinase